MSAAVLDLSTRRIKIYASAYDAQARADLEAHAADTANPHGVTKAQVGLGNADNTADAAKPISTAQATALALKAPLASPVLTGTPTAPTAVLGTVSDQLATTQFVQAAVNALDIPDVTGDLAAHLADTTNPHAVDAADVGLGNVANLAPADLPVSNATQTALNTASAATATVATNLASHSGNIANPHAVTKTQIGLGNVANLAPADLPVSTATQAAINAAVAGDDTVAADLAAHVADNDNPHQVTAADVGLGAVDNTADAAKPVSAAQQTAINVASAAAAAAQADIDGHQANLSNPHVVTKVQVGLGAVDNTADLAKPVSTATQAALNTKAPLASPALTGAPTAPTAAPGTATTQLATTAFTGAAVAVVAGSATAASAAAAAAQADATEALADADEAQAAADAAQADATQALADAAAAQTAADLAQADATAALEATEGIGDTIIGAGGASHPGETPSLYGQSKTGPADAVVPVDPAWVATSGAGSVLRIDAATAADPQTVAPAAPVPLEAGRLYELRWQVQRQTDPADPLNDSVSLGVRWLAADKSGIPGDAGTTIVIDYPLVVADGASGAGLRVAAAANPLADVVAPAGARYFRPFVDLYGNSHVTDVIVLEAWDATSVGTGVAPLILPLLNANPAAGPGVGLMALYGVRNPADGSATLRMQVGTDPVPMDIILNVGAGG